MNRFQSLFCLFLIPAAFVAEAIAETAPLSRPTTANTPQWLRITEEHVKSVVARTLPSTVALTPSMPQDRYGTGSGIVVSAEGLILTAAHVSMDMGQKVNVQFPDGTRAVAKVLGMDFGRDAGMLQIIDAGTKRFPFIEVGDSKAMKTNDWCVALGHAGGFQHDRTPPVRLGRVIENDSETFITTDSFLIGGDSGGPLLNLSGQLIGIHSNIGNSLNENNHVPISVFQENWERLLSGKRFGSGFLPNKDRPEIGVSMSDKEAGPGAVIEKIFPGSPAEKAGLRPGDAIVKLGEKEISGAEAWKREVNRLGAGDSVKLTVQPGAEKGVGKEAEKIVPITFESARKLKIPSPEDSEEVVPLKPKPKPMAPEKRAILQKEFNEMMKKALEVGTVDWTPETVDRFGGWNEMAGFLKEFSKSVPSKKIEDLLADKKPKAIRPELIDPDLPAEVSEKFFREVLDAFRPSNASASDSTHMVFRGNTWKSLCTVVHENSYVLTKASEIEGTGPLRVLIAKGKLYPARVVKNFPDHDLALLKLEDAPKLIPVQLKSDSPLPLGTLVSAVGTGPDSLAIGVISVQPRSLSGKNKGFLGIRMSPHAKGVLVNDVTADGNAGKAGIKAGDVITKVGDTPCESPEKLIRIISSTKPGQQVAIEYLRNGTTENCAVTLKSREHLDDRDGPRLSPQYHKMNSLGTEVNQKSSGFLNALQTDLPIDPQHCGGPLVDLDGNVIGINIARAGRIKTYSLPAKEVNDLLEGFKFE